MSRIEAPKPEDVPADSKPVLDAFSKSLGFTPNMLATFAKSPIAFNAWAAFRNSLNRTLDLKTREIISLAVSEVNGCNYCLAVHSYAADKAKLPADEIILARKGRAIDPKKDAAVQFARKVMVTHGNVDTADIASVLEAGYSEANLIEIIVLAVTYSITNIFNNVLDPEIDYPTVTSSALAIVPALLGMWVGTKLRKRISIATFRLCFLIFIAILGLELAVHPFFK